MADIRWWPGRGHSIPAETVVQEIRALEEEFGLAQPAMLVERARPKSSPLHDLFTWDNTVAAERYRVSEARNIMRSIRVTIHQAERVAPAYLPVKVTTPQGIKSGYMETVKALSNKTTREQVIADAMRQLRAWQRRYKMISELAKVVEAIDKAIPENGEEPGPEDEPESA